MKCEHCGKRIERKTWYHWEDSGYAEDYCSVECALAENDIKRASETLCCECGKPITEMPYTNISGNLYCCIACALGANGIEEQTR